MCSAIFDTIVEPEREEFKLRCKLNIPFSDGLPIMELYNLRDANGLSSEVFIRDCSILSTVITV